MAGPLLATKLFVPPPRPNLVPRTRLIQRLDEGLRLGRRLTLVSAPPGFGKTTLVAEWVSRDDRPVAWLSLDEADNDPVELLGYVVAALQGIDPSLGRAVQEVLQSPPLPPVRGLLIPLINDVAAAGRPLTLVLDDYHLLTSATVHQALQFALANLPPNLHVVVCTREDPPLPLAQLRVRGQVTEVRERDLRFTPAEAATFLEETMGLRLPAEAIADLEARTEGWIAGLQLAALALQESPADAATFAAAFAGDDRYVVEYLVQEVLERQPEPIRAFLRQTSILDELTAPLCDAVTGREDSQACLEQLRGANLFVSPLDHRREWYRYHRLFAEVLRTRLGRAEASCLHRRAARWYEGHGYLGEAIRHALAQGQASGDLGDAERLIRLAVEGAIHAGSMLTVRGWLDALPDERVRADGELAIARGWTLAFGGELALAAEYVEAAEAGIARGEAPDGRQGKLQLLRGVLAIGRRDYVAAIELASRALELLDEDQARWRIIAAWCLAEAQERTRPIAEAIHSLRQAQQIGQALGNQVFAAVIDSSLAADLNHHGQRQAALAVCEEAVERYVDETGRPSPLVGLILARLGFLHYEANELEPARHYVERGLALGEQLPVRSPQVFGLGVSALVLDAEGEAAAALETLRKARKLVIPEDLADTTWLPAWEADLHLRQGDVAFALRWAEEAGLSPDDELEFLRVDEHLAYARLLLARGRLDDARRWLARLEGFARERELSRPLLSVRILQALASDRADDHSGARNCLAAALELAAPEGYYRAFLDEDARLVGLLPEVRQAAPAFVARLLEFAGIPASRPGAASQPLIEPLSERELEVLALIAAGHSNQEIANRLVIAPGTVKRHINHIYGKLDVASRTQAIAKARALHLL